MVETAELRRENEALRGQVAALARANVHAAELMAELREARELEELLRRQKEELARAQQAEHARSRVLEVVAQHESTPVLMDAFVEFAQSQLPGRNVSFFLNERDGLRHAGHTGIPDELASFLEGQAVGAQTGPGECWKHGKPSFWKMGDRPEGEFEEACARVGIVSCCSYPVISSAGAVLGVATMYGRAECSISPREQEGLEQMLVLVSLGLEQRNLYERLSYQAHYDGLTALPNRTLFNQQLHKAIRDAKDAGTQLAVLWIDLDRFKQINDTLGHRAGDSLLKQVAGRLRKSVRSEDVVARMGGDEFTIFLRHVNGLEGAVRAGEKVLASFEKTFRVLDQDLSISASIGVSVFPQHGGSCEELSRNADIAMYSTKNAGRRGVTLFTPENDEKIRDRFQLEMHLRQALERSELELHFQPQVPVGNVEVFSGVEALLRWTSPELGRVPPNRFIPVAESSGLIVPIGQWVLEQACRVAAHWERRGRRVRMAVNVSGEQFCRTDFVGRVREVLAESGLSAELLDLELTESSLLRDGGQCKKNMLELREMGVRLSIDDFGTGYSSLNYLHTLPVNTVKVDRSFIKELTTSVSSTRLVEAVVKLANALHLEVVAEGVETAEQFEKLEEMGCDYVQGYYVHEPLPRETVERLILGQR